MPIKVDAFLCGTCENLFTGKNSYIQAENCENKGKPKHRYKVDQLLVLTRIFYTSKQIVKVVRAYWKKQTHVPCYDLKYAGGTNAEDKLILLEKPSKLIATVVEEMQISNNFLQFFEK